MNERDIILKFSLHQIAQLCQHNSLRTVCSLCFVSSFRWREELDHSISKPGIVIFITAPNNIQYVRKNVF